MDELPQIINVLRGDMSFVGHDHRPEFVTQLSKHIPSDEIGDLLLALQAKILRFLQEWVIERVGDREEIIVDVLVVCATYRELEEMIGQGEFREDLYYRISEITMPIPALRERKGDSLLLAKSFLGKYIKQLGQPLKKFSSAAIAAIEQHLWPDNVRELENRGKRAILMAVDDHVTPEDLELASIISSYNIANVLNLRDAGKQAETNTIRQALVFIKNYIFQAAELLGESRPTLYELMNKVGFN